MLVVCELVHSSCFRDFSFAFFFLFVYSFTVYSRIALNSLCSPGWLRILSSSSTSACRVLGLLANHHVLRAQILCKTSPNHCGGSELSREMTCLQGFGVLRLVISTVLSLIFFLTLGML